MLFFHIEYSGKNVDKTLTSCNVHRKTLELNNVNLKILSSFINSFVRVD